MGIIIIFIKNLSKYSFISVLCILYARILADYKSGCREGIIFLINNRNIING